MQKARNSRAAGSYGYAMLILAHSAHIADKGAQACRVHKRDFGQVNNYACFIFQLAQGCSEFPNCIGVQIAFGLANYVVDIAVGFDFQHKNDVSRLIFWMMKENRILVATDSRELFEQVKSALHTENTQLIWAQSGQDAMDAVKGKVKQGDSEAVLLLDLVVCDMQIQNMGGIAVSYDIYLEVSSGRIPALPVLLLLDRQADVFLAESAGAAAYIIKPVNILKLRQIAGDLLSSIAHGAPSARGAPSAAQAVQDSMGG